MTFGAFLTAGRLAAACRQYASPQCWLPANLIRNNDLVSAHDHWAWLRTVSLSLFQRVVLFLFGYKYSKEKLGNDALFSDSVNDVAWYNVAATSVDGASNVTILHWRLHVGCT